MIVLDTHAWVWWLGEPKKLSRKAKSSADRARNSNTLYVSCMSTWELALLVQRGRLELDASLDEWVARSERLGFIRFVPLSNSIALRARTLHGLHADPVDRIIAATTLELGATLITKDAKLSNWRGVRTIW